MRHVGSSRNSRMSSARVAALTPSWRSVYKLTPEPRRRGGEAWYTRTTRGASLDAPSSPVDVGARTRTRADASPAAASARARRVVSGHGSAPFAGFSYVCSRMLAHAGHRALRPGAHRFEAGHFNDGGRRERQNHAQHALKLHHVARARCGRLGRIVSLRTHRLVVGEDLRSHIIVGRAIIRAARHASTRGFTTASAKSSKKASIPSNVK